MASRKIPPPSIRLVESAATEWRCAEARAFVRAHLHRGEVWLVKYLDSHAVARDAARQGIVP